jgi:hypothetical protein
MPMRYTVKYCVQCRRTLSRNDQSPEATAFLNAYRSIEGNTARIREVIIEESDHRRRWRLLRVWEKRRCNVL